MENDWDRRMIRLGSRARDKRPLIRSLALAFCVLTGTGRGIAATTPPAVIQPYTRSGHFEPGDYAWMRGSFGDATPSDKSVWLGVQDWLQRCKDNDQVQTRAALKAAGIPDPQVADGPFDDVICDEVGLAIPHLGVHGFEDLKPLVRPSSLTAAAVIWTANTARQVGLSRNPSVQDQLRARVLVDQSLRRAVVSDSFGDPVLSVDETAVVASQLWLAIRRADHDNTTWLKNVIQQSGWIDAERYGAEAADAAWLLVQHADQDPLFQYRMLRDLDPTRSAGTPKVPRRRYALLSDRVALKITGKQTYGSQLICRAGNWVPFPIDDPANVDVRRAQMDLEPLQKYVEKFIRDVGRCRS